MTKTKFDKTIKDNQLNIKDISQLTGIGKARIHGLIYLGQFPQSTEKVFNPKGSPLCVWDKDEVMNWCEERFETIKHLLNEYIGRSTIPRRDKKGRINRVANPATNKRTKKSFDQLKFLSSQPFSAGHWKGQLVYKKSKWVGAE